MLTYKEALMGGSCLCGQFGQVPFPLPLLGLSGYMYKNIHNSQLSDLSHVIGIYLTF